jgi:hypothetical protein
LRAGLPLVVVVLVGWAGAAHAYPQFQLSMGERRCSACHYAPAGGGLINGFGREEAGDSISAGGDGHFLHGLWQPPSWLALGADVRVAALATDEGARTGVDTALFPMQADLYLRVGEPGGGFSASATVGFRGATRPVDNSLASRLISREHYLMWREGATGFYARAGRFFAPYGLRLPEHTAYVRRFLGFDTLEETYGLSGGYVSDEWELHATAFVPDFVRDAAGTRGAGAAALFERREGEAAAWGAQARVAVGDEDDRVMGGLTGKLFFDGPRLQLLAELDLVRQGFRRLSTSRAQLAAYLGAAWFPARGFLVQLMLERWDEDLGVAGVARDAAGVELQWFPTAHVEVGLYGRAQLIGSGASDGSASELVLLQLHYYL